MTNKLFFGKNPPRNGEGDHSEPKARDGGGGPLRQRFALPPPRVGEDLIPHSGESDRSEQSGGGAPPVLQAPIKQVKRARKLRREMSLPEVLLWQELRKKPNGFKFRRQFPTGRITTDFACLSHRLIIEVDGEGHSFGDRPQLDAARDAMLGREGFRVLRVPAREVLRDLDAAIRWIVATCDPPRNGEVAGPRSGADGGGPLHHDAARRGPPPRSGEDL